jgi:Carboxypeptidase regulatory-like domain
MQNFTRFSCAFGALLLAFGVGVGQLNAQATAAISGTVTDSSGAVISDTLVQAKNTGTGINSTTTSDAQGRFRFPDLTIGSYEIQASKTGFSTELRKGVTLTVGSQAVLDFQLPVGQQTQTVTVEGQVSQVETQSSAVGALVESKQIRDLPLNGRNFTQLITLAPGVTQIPLGAPGAGSTFYGNGQKYTIAGSRPSGQAYLLDDQDMVNFWNNGPGAGGLGTALGVEAIAEFQALTNTYSSKFGGNGAVINASSRSGTNAFHGSAYEFLRNNVLEARNFFDRTTPPFRQNQFGASAGGAIKKDKAFFFVNYEGLRQRKTNTNVVVVPDVNAHNFILPTGPVTQNSDPAVRLAIQNTLALYPTTGFIKNLGNGTAQALVDDPLKGDQNYMLARIDYTLSEKSSLFVRYVVDRAQREFTTNVPWWPETDTTRDHFVSVEERHTISPKLLNLAHVGFSRTYEDAFVNGSPVVSNGSVSAGTIATAGIHPLQFFGTSAGREDGTVALGSGLTSVGASTTLPFYLVPNKFQFGDDVIWTSGAHSLTFGANVTRLRENTWAPFIVGGNWTFTSLQNFLQGNPASIQGQVSDAQNPTADATKDYRYTVSTMYIDDQWKVLHKLTVNLGLRYSPTSMINQTKHQQFNLVQAPEIDNKGLFVPVTTSTATNPSLRNWDPRIGLAFDPFADHKTSIRVSFGVFHNVLYSRDTNHWLQPPFLTATQTSAQGLQYVGTCAIACSPFTNVPPPGLIPTNGSLSISNGDYFGVAHTPYQMQWNFNIQREIMNNTVFSIGYIGSHNLHMFAQKDFNYPIPTTGPTGRPTFSSQTGVANARINPFYSSLQLADNLADSHYHAMQTSLNRRFRTGWQSQVSYTWSKSIDNSSGTYGLDGGGAVANPTNIASERGLSNFNRTHNFRLSGIYAVPFRTKGLMGGIVNGWQLTGGFTYLSGAPATITSASNRVFTGTGGNTGRPDVVPGCDIYAGQSLHGLWFNPNCYTLQAIGTYGNLGRSTIIGPNLWNLDNSVSKDFRVSRISEQFAVEFRAELFNILNHPSFQNPVTANIFVGNPGAGAQAPGVALNASAGTITATNSQPRQLQLALKIVF